MNRLITWNEIEYVIKTLPTNESPGPECYTGEFYQTYKEQLKPILLKFFQMVEKEGTLPKTFYDAMITLIPKPDRDNTKKENYRANIFDEYRCKISPQNLSQLNPTTYPKIIHHDQVGFIPGSQGWFNICKSINIIHHINRSQKSYDHLHRCRKSIWQSPTSIPDQDPLFLFWNKFYVFVYILRLFIHHLPPCWLPFVNYVCSSFAISEYLRQLFKMFI